MKTVVLPSLLLPLTPRSAVYVNQWNITKDVMWIGYTEVEESNGLINAEMNGVTSLPLTATG
jgi:hypothetical protein